MIRDPFGVNITEGLKDYDEEKTEIAIKKKP